MGKSFIVARRSDLPEGGGKMVEAAGRTIALFNADGKLYAIDNACLHRGGSLAAGDVYGTHVVCPLHGWEYDFTTGCSVDDPSMKLRCYRVRTEGDDIIVEL